MAEIVLNGKRREIESGETVSALLDKLGLDARWVVAELNGDPIGRERFSEVGLMDGDRLELVRAVAGG